MPLFQQLCYALIHQIRFSCVSQSYKHVIQSIHELYVTMNQFYLSNISLILNYQ